MRRIVVPQEDGEGVVGEAPWPAPWSLLVAEVVEVALGSVKAVAWRVWER